MNHADRIGRSLASLTRHAGALLTHRAAVLAMAATPQPQPHAPLERLRTAILPARLPHAIQLCIHCRERPAEFWVSRTGSKTVRRPWCLSCCQAADRDQCDVIRFPSWQDAKADTSQRPPALRDRRNDIPPQRIWTLLSASADERCAPRATAGGARN